MLSKAEVTLIVMRGFLITEGVITEDFENASYPTSLPDILEEKLAAYSGNDELLATQILEIYLETLDIVKAQNDL